MNRVKKGSEKMTREQFLENERNRYQKRCGELATIRYGLLAYIIKNKMASDEQFDELLKIAFPE